MRSLRSFWLIFAVLGGVVIGLLLQDNPSAQSNRVAGHVMRLDQVGGIRDDSVGGAVVAYCFTSGSGIHCVRAF